MTRELTSHKVNGLNEVLKIVVHDEPDPTSLANHRYQVIPMVGNALGLLIEFQHGPLNGNPPNGLSNEALLAIVEDRLIGFQSGIYACRENAVALTKLQECMMWLHKRTRDRIARGVEGTMEK